MPEEWATRRLADIADIYDGPHATPPKTNSGPWFLSISSLDHGRLDLSQSAHVDGSDFEKWTRRVVPEPGDVLFSYETRLGQAASMPQGLRACLGRRMGILRPRRNIVNPRFLLYAYLSPAFQATIKRWAVRGATVDRIPLNQLRDWPIHVPSRATQDAIAEVLGALDDKIELNDRVHRLSNELADARLVQLLERAEAARRLRVVRLGDIALVNSRKVRPSSGQIRYFDITSIGCGKADNPESMDWADAPSRARRAVRDGDTIWSTVRPNRRSHCLLLDPPDNEVI